VKRRISAGEARKKLGELLEGVFYRGDEVVIERAGKPMAVVIPAERYEALARSRERMFDLIEQAHERNKDVPLDVIEREVSDAIDEVRRGGRTKRS
jgi:prevent-host-death family protein